MQQLLPLLAVVAAVAARELGRREGRKGREGSSQESSRELLWTSLHPASAVVVVEGEAAVARSLLRPTLGLPDGVRATLHLLDVFSVVLASAVCQFMCHSDGKL